MQKDKRISEWYSRLSKAQKVQAIAAAALTLASFVTFPVLAWFGYQTKVETMSFVNDPPTLSLAAGHNDTIQCFELKNINVKRENDGAYYQDFVFSVETEKVREYDIQITHTTNIPFVYELYRAKEDASGTVRYEVREGADKGTIVNYKILTGSLTDGDITVLQDITLTNLNPKDTSARQVGSESVLKQEYNRENYDAGDNVNQYVEPLYSVARHIQTNIKDFDGSDDRDYFVLRMKWNVKNKAQGQEYWQYAFNDKETDIVYISLKESPDSSSNSNNGENNNNEGNDNNGEG